MNSPPKITAKKSICSRILTPKQVGPICWFMATFVAMFYSQRSRKLLLNASKGWDKSNKLFELLKHVLDDRYLKTGNSESDDYQKFSDNTFMEILKLLHKEDKKKFMYNPDVNKDGFSPHFYIGKLYNLLNVDYTMFEYDVTNDYLVYSLFNEEYNDDYDYKLIQEYDKDKKTYVFKKITITAKPKTKFEKNIRATTRVIYNALNFYKDGYERLKESDKLLKLLNNSPRKFKEAHTIFNNTPSVLIVFTGNLTYNTTIYGEGTYLQPNINLHNNVNDPIIRENIGNYKEKMVYNGAEYNLDSVILASITQTNYYNGSHMIAGITCKKKRYVYNGWTRTSMDPAMANANITRGIPCELMKHNWSLHDYGSYCLNKSKCQLDLIPYNGRDPYMCFDFSEGIRYLIYVRKDNNSITSSNVSSRSSKSNSRGSGGVGGSGSVGVGRGGSVGRGVGGGVGVKTRKVMNNKKTIKVI